VYKNNFTSVYFIIIIIIVVVVVVLYLFYHLICIAVVYCPYGEIYYIWY